VDVEVGFPVVVDVGFAVVDVEVGFPVVVDVVFATRQANDATQPLDLQRVESLIL